MCCCVIFWGKTAYCFKNMPNVTNRTIDTLGLTLRGEFIMGKYRDAYGIIEVIYGSLGNDDYIDRIAAAFNGFVDCSSWSIYVNKEKLIGTDLGSEPIK